MWNRDEIECGVRYRVGLIAAPDGTRRFRLLKPSDDTDGCDFFTPEIDEEDLLKRRDFAAILKRHGVVGQTRIHIDAHGIWLTDHEANQMYADKNFDDIQWHNGIVPNFPPI